jgi:hypothetical protein
MADIEFLDSGDQLDTRVSDHPSPPPHEPQPSPAPARTPVALRAHWPTLASAGLCVLAAVVGVLAAFREVYRIAFGSEFNNTTLAVDGWGRIRDASSATPAGEHGAVYGIVLCVAAAALVVAAVLGAIPRTRAALRGFALLGAGLLAGVTAAAALAAQSEFDDVRAQLHLESLDSAEHTPPGHLSTTYGWSIWLGLIATALAVLAIVLPVAVSAVQRRAVRRHETIAAVPPPPEFHPEDEVLG